ncbi:probable cytochrome P450 6a14 [Schistocerca americana]|uniref:probable cytochrome P450 6a14 n=1 Tax=Schistocerca americana TaxID=7009 RepID=UPI001F4FDAF9|nr:probable cytochrome P450 6a14 [Schistocerca americana]
MLQLLAALVAACAAVALYAYYCWSYWPRRGIPYIPGAPFPFGHAWRAMLFQRYFGDICCDLYSAVPPSEPMVGIYMFTQPGIVVKDPELIKSMLVKDFQHFHDRGLYVNEDVDPLTGHLVFMAGERWRLLRNRLTPTFTSGKMKMMFPTLEKCARELVEVMGAGSRDVEFFDLLARYGTDVIASCAFGLETHSLQNPDQEFRKWARRLFVPTPARGLIGTFCNIFPSIANTFRIHTISPDVDEYFTTLVKDAIEYRDSHGVSRADFLQLLMNLRDDQSTDKTPGSKDIKLTLGQLTAQCAVFLLAGFETSSTTMSLALHELAFHQDIQKKLQQEIDEALQKSGGQLTYDNVMNMPYLDKVVSETLRKYPPLPMLNRAVTQEYTVPDRQWVLEKGTMVLIPVMAVHNDPQHYPDPQRFDPERFSEEEKSKRHPFAYLPFGDGPRVCIGMRFGLMQTKMGLASLLSHYSVEPCDRTVRKLEWTKRSLLLNPVSGIWLRYTSRGK